MSVSLLEIVEAAGYDLSTREGALWIQSKQREFETLVEQAEERLEQDD